MNNTTAQTGSLETMVLALLARSERENSRPLMCTATRNALASVLNVRVGAPTHFMGVKITAHNVTVADVCERASDAGAPLRGTIAARCAALRALGFVVSVDTLAGVVSL